MGQYYRAIFLAEDRKTPVAIISPYDYANGAKLMEHSWIGNEFVEAVETHLLNKQSFVWAGDYADGEVDGPLNPNGKRENLFSIVRTLERTTPIRIKPVVNEVALPRFLLNHTKKEYVDKTKSPAKEYIWTKPEKWAIHPLPLLTNESNGRGGGDYNKNSKLIGSWARDVISVEDNVPSDYKEIKFKLTE